MNRNKLLKWGLLVGAVTIIGLSLGTIGYIYTKVSAFDKVFARNVYIEDLSVGGLTKEEVKIKLEDMKESEHDKQSLILYKGDIESEIAFSEIGITYNIDETIDSAFQEGHNASFFEKYRISQEGLPSIKEYTLERTFDTQPIRAFIEKSSKLFNVEPINASIERKNRQFVITPEVNGEVLDQETTYQKILEAIDQPASSIHKVEAVTKVAIPEYTEASFMDIQTLVASFSTSYNNASANRNANLVVAANKISRTLLPDEIFYLSKQLEPFTTEAGYKNAGVIVNGKLEDGLGGGVCQVASTLYNAVLLTDIEVVMRQNHSLPVAYVPLGRDATYATGVIDFQFKNNTGYPLFIEGYCENNHVYVNIYGHKSAKSEYDIKFESVLTDVIPAPQAKYEDDPTLPKGKEVVDTKALDGKRIKLYKLYYKNNVLEKKELVDSSYYKPRAAVIKRGTKETDPLATAVPSPSPSPSASPSPSPSDMQPEVIEDTYTDINDVGSETDDNQDTTYPDDLNTFEIPQI